MAQIVRVPAKTIPQSFSNYQILIDRRMKAEYGPNIAACNDFLIIQPQSFNGGPAADCFSNNFSPVPAPLKMLMPSLQTRMKQARNFSGRMIPCLNPIALILIAAMAG